MTGPHFFLDRSLGRHRVPNLLREDGWSVVTLAEHYGVPADETVDDVNWLELAGNNHWPALMKDEKIRYRPAERAAVVAHDVRAFYLTSGNLTSQQMADPFILHRANIWRLATHPGPALFRRLQRRSSSDRPENYQPPVSTKAGAPPSPLTATHTGTATVDLGSRPPRANAVSVSLSCLSPGAFTFPNGASLTCDNNSITTTAGPPTSPNNVMKISPGQTEIGFGVSDGASWQVTTLYVRSVGTPWPVNANGDTYGIEDGNGSPDLIRVIATNGKSGYSYAADLEGPTPTSPAEATQMQQDGAFDGPFFAPGYESDGETRIGTFRFG